MAFPLYDRCFEKINHNDHNKSISQDQKQEIADFIKKSSNDKHELVYMLMKTHQLKCDTPSNTNMPFNGKEQKHGVKFDIDVLPNELQHILYTFIKMDSQIDTNN